MLLVIVGQETEMGDVLDIPPVSPAQIEDAGGKGLQVMYGPQVIL